MRSLLIAMALVAAACWTGEVTDGSNSTTSTTEPEPTQLELLTEARALWNETKPDEYLFRYRLICECIQGPWTIHVTGRSTDLLNGPADSVPYRTIDEIFQEIAGALEDGRFPVEAEYGSDGYPVSYIFNGPEMPVDGGFILEITTFDSEPDISHVAIQEAELEDALAKWEQAGPVSYDYVLTRNCFCPQQFIGPYDGSVRNGEIVLVTYQGDDTAKVKGLEDTPYAEVAPDVRAMFEIVREAIKQADEVTVTYHPDLGYPTKVSIDWIRDAVDDEVGYQLETVVSFTGEPAN